MTWLRTGTRLLLIALSTVVFWVLLIVGMLLTLPWPTRRVRWRGMIFQNWSRLLLTIMGIEVETDGTPPNPPFFLVSNHLSYIDIPVLASHVGVVFIAKSEIASWPVVGLVCKSANTIFIDRDARRDIPRVMDLIHHELDLGAGVVVFPEGTSSMGETILPFRPSLLEVAARAEMPVSFAVLSYDIPGGVIPASRAVCWWGGMPFGSHILKLLSLKRARARVVFADRMLTDSDRKQLASRLHEALMNIFEPTHQKEIA